MVLSLRPTYMSPVLRRNPVTTCCRGAQVIVACRVARSDQETFQVCFLFTITHIASTKKPSSGRSLLKKSSIIKLPFTDISQRQQDITNWSGRVTRIRAPCSTLFPTISFKFVPGRDREKAQISPRHLVSRLCCRAVFHCPSQHKSIISCYRFLIGKSSLQSYFSE